MIMWVASSASVLFTRDQFTFTLLLKQKGKSATQLAYLSICSSWSQQTLILFKSMPSRGLKQFSSEIILSVSVSTLVKKNDGKDGTKLTVGHNQVPLLQYDTKKKKKENPI